MIRTVIEQQIQTKQWGIVSLAKRISQKISIGSEDEKRVETLWNYYQNEEKNG